MFKRLCDCTASHCIACTKHILYLQTFSHFEFSSTVRLQISNMDNLTLTEVIIVYELKWRYRDVDEARFMQILAK